MPPSAMASYTTPASVRPDWGRASGEFSIIIQVVASVVAAAFSTSLPVSGE